MKINMSVMLVLAILTCSLTGCASGSEDNSQAESNVSVSAADVSETLPDTSASIETEISSDVTMEEMLKEETSEKTEAASEDTVDVDLTTLSSTMVYSEVYNMLSKPDDYIGKKVKMNGQFVLYSNQDESQYYPAVIIADATACCSQGLEFILMDSSGYPDGYPEVESEITVVGTFETYEEEGYTYCHLVDAVIE